MCPTTRTATDASHMDPESFSSICCTFRRTHTSADPIWIFRIRLALTMTPPRPSGLVLNARLVVCISPRGLWSLEFFSCNFIHRDERGGGLAGQPESSQVDTATIRTVLSTNRVDSRSLSSICWTFRRTHTSAGPIRLLCIRLALPLTLSLPSGFVPSARLLVCVSSQALWLAGDFRLMACLGTRGEEDFLGNSWDHRWTLQPLERY